MSENGAYTQARVRFEKAKRDTAHRAKTLVCGTTLRDGKGCTATGIYVETFRGAHYHFVGTCDAGHITERYGYADKEVVEE
jgi:hypothetical protein